MTPEILLFFPLLLFSVIAHEVAHGVVALRQGDDTALHSGRLTLNPLPHIDPMGSVIFPLICWFMKLPIFGWARPVPVNPLRFHNYRSGMVLVSMAGPLTNILIAVGFTFGISVLAAAGWEGGMAPTLVRVFSQGVLLNLVLAVFNLLPIPPLDGSKVVSVLLPPEAAERYDALEPYGFFILMGLMAFGVLGRLLYPAVILLYRFLLGSFGIL